MQLKELLQNITVTNVVNIENIDVSSVVFDSRKIEQNCIFIAIKGTASDGHKFIESAIQQGAKAIVVNHDFQYINDNVVIIRVADTSKALGEIAANFYNHPSKQLKLVGVTGTNGKTTVATLCYQLFTTLGHTCGLISTVENKIGNEIIPSTHTTPDALNLNKLLAEMVSKGCTHAFMEVSSHAVHQHRIHGLHFAGGAFTNITHDHLDYHTTFDNYIKAKKGFFDSLPKSAFAIVNIDDKRGAVMIQNTHAKRVSFALKNPADYKVKILESDFEGTLLKINEHELHIRLVGEFNAYNMAVVYAIACELGENSEDILLILSNTRGAKGRFDVYYSSDKRFAIVDYAHTPDALENVLKTIKNIKQDTQQLITVVGCGGDRDKTKRPIMARIACDFSNKVILTSDNPRTENPDTILHEMELGVDIIQKKKTFKMSNREEAIKLAVSLLQPNDIVLIAGKGHENYQEIQGVKYPFDDKEIVQKYINQ